MSKLVEFTFPDTGIVVKLRKISPYLATDVEAATPLPLPPEQEVDYGEPKGKVKERNYSDPGYTLSLKARDHVVYQSYQRAVILRAVVVEGEDWKNEVKEYRDFFQKTTGYALEEKEDLLVYVLRICVGTEEDLVDLLKAITQRSYPTPEVVDQAKGSFQGPVQGT